jgi:transcriptional regulator with XRE-family HTH domain/tetratricopeptide (TPR) repeat protein
MSINTRLRNARLQAGLSQAELADQLGVTKITINRWERKKSTPHTYYQQRLSSLLLRSEDELFGESEQTLAVGSEQAEQLLDPTTPLALEESLIGRDDDLTRIRERLCSSTLAMLNGLPGVGKTALAITLAHDPEIREHFHDGILWAGLGPNPNVTAHLSRWGQLLGLSADQMGKLNTPADWARALRAAISERSMVLVIDDAWSVEVALALKIGGLHCGHLVTTRSPNIAAQLTVDGATTLHELNEEQGIDLLRQLAPQAVDVEQRKAYDLVQIAGGLPLALTLMGNYLRTQAYTGPKRRVLSALSRLSDARTRLELEEPRGPVETHPSLSIDVPISLQSVIAVTVDHLDQEARHALTLLSIFPAKPDNFSENAANALGVDNEVLDRLIDKGLLLSSGEHYTLPQTIRDYAYQYLSQEEKDIAFQRLAHYMSTLVKTQRHDYQLLANEQSTLLLILEEAIGAKNYKILSDLIYATPFLMLRGLYTLAEALLRPLMHIKSELQGEDLLLTYLYLGQLEQKRSHNGLPLFLEVLPLVRELHDENEKLLFELLINIGIAYTEAGEIIKAEETFQEALEIARSAAVDRILVTALQNAGRVQLFKGNADKAIEIFQEALPLAQRIETDITSFLLISLGVTHAMKGDKGQAIDCLTATLQAIPRGDQETRQVALLNLGTVYGQSEEYSKAQSFLEEAMQIATALERYADKCMIMLNLAQIAIFLKEDAQAETLFQEAEELIKQYKLQPHLRNILQASDSAGYQRIKEEEKIFLKRVESILR